MHYNTPFASSES